MTKAKYTVEFTDDVENLIRKIRKSGDRILFKKLDLIFSELEEHPKTGIGRPEQLRHYKTPTWSRRLSGQHRIIYEIHDDVLIVLVLDALGHYGDK